MFDPVIADLNNYLASQERLEALSDLCADEQDELETVQARVKELEAMDYDTEWNDSLDEELAGLYDREKELQELIDDTMSGERWNNI